jgi:hypothetical protein
MSTIADAYIESRPSLNTIYCIIVASNYLTIFHYCYGDFDFGLSVNGTYCTEG